MAENNNNDSGDGTESAASREDVKLERVGSSDSASTSDMKKQNHGSQSIQSTLDIDKDNEFVYERALAELINTLDYVKGNPGVAARDFMYRTFFGSNHTAVTNWLGQTTQEKHQSVSQKYLNDLKLNDDDALYDRKQEKSVYSVYKQTQETVGDGFLTRFRKFFLGDWSRKQADKSQLKIGQENTHSENELVRGQPLEYNRYAFQLFSYLYMHEYYEKSVDLKSGKEIFTKRSLAERCKLEELIDGVIQLKRDGVSAKEILERFFQGIWDLVNSEILDEPGTTLKSSLARNYKKLLNQWATSIRKQLPEGHDFHIHIKRQRVEQTNQQETEKTRKSFEAKANDDDAGSEKQALLKRSNDEKENKKKSAVKKDTNAFGYIISTEKRQYDATFKHENNQVKSRNKGRALLLSGIVAFGEGMVAMFLLGAAFSVAMWFGLAAMAVNFFLFNGSANGLLDDLFTFVEINGKPVRRIFVNQYGHEISLKTKVASGICGFLCLFAGTVLGALSFNSAIAGLTAMALFLGVAASPPGIFIVAAIVAISTAISLTALFYCGITRAIKNRVDLQIRKALFTDIPNQISRLYETHGFWSAFGYGAAKFLSVAVGVGLGVLVTMATFGLFMDKTALIITKMGAAPDVAMKIALAFTATGTVVNGYYYMDATTTATRIIFDAMYRSITQATKVFVDGVKSRFAYATTIKDYWAGRNWPKLGNVLSGLYTAGCALWYFTGAVVVETVLTTAVKLMTAASNPIKQRCVWMYTGFMTFMSACVGLNGYAQGGGSKIGSEKFTKNPFVKNVCAGAGNAGSDGPNFSSTAAAADFRRAMNTMREIEAPDSFNLLKPLKDSVKSKSIKIVKRKGQNGRTMTNSVNDGSSSGDSVNSVVDIKTMDASSNSYGTGERATSVITEGSLGTTPMTAATNPVLRLSQGAMTPLNLGRRSSRGQGFVINVQQPDSVRSQRYRELTTPPAMPSSSSHRNRSRQRALSEGAGVVVESLSANGIASSPRCRKA